MTAPSNTLPRSVPDKLYGRTDIDQVNTPLPDGSIHRHERTKAMGKLDETQFVLSCKECIAETIKRDPSIMTKDLAGGNIFTTHWSPTPSLVPKSSAEQMQEKAAEKDFVMGNYQDFEDFKAFREHQRARRRGGVNLAQ